MIMVYLTPYVNHNLLNLRRYFKLGTKLVKINEGTRIPLSLDIHKTF